MNFPQLEIENFLTIGQAKLSLADRGLVLFQGINEDDSSAHSNGAGKSSIADALCWCLYGTTARDESGDAVVNRKAGKNCRVATTAVDGDDVYKIVRHRKHKQGKNALHLFKQDATGDWTDLTKGTDKLTQEEVLKVIGSSFEVFCGSVYAGQEKMPDLPGMTDKKLKLLVEEASGTTVLEQAYEVARKRLLQKESDKTYAEASLKAEIVAQTSIIAQQEQANTDHAGFEKRRRDRLRSLAEEARELARQAGELGSEITAAGKSGVETALKEAQDKLAGVKGEQAEERRLADELAKIEREVASGTADLRSLKVAFDRAKVDLDGISERVGQPCGECGKAYCEHDLEEATTRARAKLADVKKQFATTRSQVESAQKRAQSARDALSTHRASLTDVSEASALSASLNTKMSNIAALERKRENLINQARDRAKQAKAVRAEDNPFAAIINRLMDQAKEVTSRIEGAEKKVKEAEAALEIAKSVAKVFSPAGVRAHILDEVTPFLNDQTAKYLGALSDGNIRATWSTLVKNAKGELREKFSIEVENDCGGETFKSISGGEKRKVRIAAALALQDLVARRASKPIDLFIGDEIDDALDPAGLERLTTILHEKARERGSVMVISHADLKDWISQIVTVRKAGGQSTIEETVA
ncbi:AAA domain-containing protein [Faunimonas pinastri]|uniref:AAA domain-containing protein n=1 Tax=Faunimonas pinastri TaxID=1855383 RepID=A0A1H9MY15_9HYPH|nr:AAA family ATPase [Faunimonas pinastri]SER28427.1 AAA domain-containing protein [Faunimonas pinastri]